MVIRAEHPHPAMALPVASTRTFGGSSPEAVESFTERTKPPKVLVLCYLIAIDLLLYCCLTLLSQKNLFKPQILFSCYSAKRCDVAERTQLA
jgi:hypothetical protein